ncbi:hypothetical protein BT69DRAFT_1283585 [Atractiella rhizophila]|nr:hypothetical protein BT69DRAFT_1283585 [Atractiella rhizophila]
MSSSRDSPVSASFTFSQPPSVHFPSEQSSPVNHHSPEESTSHHQSPDESASYLHSPEEASSPSSSGHGPSHPRTWGDSGKLRPVIESTRSSQDADRGRSHTRKGRSKIGSGDPQPGQEEMDLDIRRLELKEEEDEGIGRSVSSTRLPTSLVMANVDATPIIPPNPLADDVKSLRLKVQELEILNMRLQNTVELLHQHVLQSQQSPRPSPPLSAPAPTLARTTQDETNGFIRDLQSHGLLQTDKPVDATYLVMLDLLKRKYNYKPGDLHTSNLSSNR